MEFATLLAAMLLISVLTSIAVSGAFSAPARRVLDRIVTKDLAGAWHRYLVFATCVVGISGGTRIWNLERYVMPQGQEPPFELDGPRWLLESYATFLGAMQSCAWVLLVFFLTSLFAFVILRGFELRRSVGERTDGPKEGV